MAHKNNRITLERNLRVAEKNQLLVSKIKRAKEAMVKDFLGLKVTQEIIGGPHTTNISGTLGGYGNLFSFIGFNEGEQPINPIITLLNQTTFRITQMNTRGSFKVIIEIPSAEDIFAVTPLPWAAGISWAKRIEVGMSGLGMYLNTPSDYSRSGGGIQTDKKIRGGRFSNTRYITWFLKEWQKKFLRIDKSIKLAA